MQSSYRKSVLAVPIGLKKIFMRESVPEGKDNVVPFRKIVEIDPTHPGHDEFIDALNGELDYELEHCDPPANTLLPPPTSKRPDLRLV